MKTIVLVNGDYNIKDEIKIRHKFINEINVIVLNTHSFIRSKTQLLERGDKLIISEIKNNKITTLKKVKI